LKEKRGEKQRRIARAKEEETVPISTWMGKGKEKDEEVRRKVPSG